MLIFSLSLQVYCMYYQSRSNWIGKNWLIISDDVVRFETKYKHPICKWSEPGTFGFEVHRTILCTVGISHVERFEETISMPVLMSWSWVWIPRQCFHIFQFPPSYTINLGSAGQGMWNVSWFCSLSFNRAHANLLCILIILVYVLPKQVQLDWQKLAYYLWWYSQIWDKV